MMIAEIDGQGVKQFTEMAPHSCVPQRLAWNVKFAIKARDSVLIRLSVLPPPFFY